MTFRSNATARMHINARHTCAYRASRIISRIRPMRSITIISNASLTPKNSSNPLYSTPQFLATFRRMMSFRRGRICNRSRIGQIRFGAPETHGVRPRFVPEPSLSMKARFASVFVYDGDPRLVPGSGPPNPRIRTGTNLQKISRLPRTLVPSRACAGSNSSKDHRASFGKSSRMGPN